MNVAQSYNNSDAIAKCILVTNTSVNTTLKQPTPKTNLNFKLAQFKSLSVIIWETRKCSTSDTFKLILLDKYMSINIQTCPHFKTKYIQKQFFWAVASIAHVNETRFAS